jgi:hypothetical protein
MLSILSWDITRTDSTGEMRISNPSGNFTLSVDDEQFVPPAQERHSSRKRPVGPPPPRPHFQMLPPDIQERTIRLLARLLRRQADQPLVSGEALEARDE